MTATPRKWNIFWYGQLGASGMQRWGGKRGPESLGEALDSFRFALPDLWLTHHLQFLVVPAPQCWQLGCFGEVSNSGLKYHLYFPETTPGL